MYETCSFIYKIIQGIIYIALFLSMWSNRNRLVMNKTKIYTLSLYLRYEHNPNVTKKLLNKKSQNIGIIIIKLYLKFIESLLYFVVKLIE